MTAPDLLVERKAPGWWRPAERPQLAAAPATAAGETFDAAGAGRRRGGDRGEAGGVPVWAARDEERHGAFPFAALLAFTIILILAPQSFVPGLGALRPALAAAALGIGALVAARLVRGEPLSRVSPANLPAGLLLGWAVVSIPFSIWPGGSAGVVGGLFLKSLAVFWLLPNVLTTTRRLSGLTLALALMSAPLALSAVQHYASGDIVAGGDYRTVKRIEGYEAPLTQNPNDLALTLNLLLPFAAAHAALARRPLVRLLLGGLVLLDAAGVVLTFSRGGFLTLGVILLLGAGLVFRGRRGGALVALLAILLVLALPLLPASYLGYMRTILHPASDPSGSAQERWSDMVSATRLALASPVLGVGSGMNLLALNGVRGASWKSVHNVYLEYAVDLGLTGLALFLALFAVCLLEARRAERARARAPDGRRLVAIGAASRVSLLAFAVSGMFSPVAYHFYFFYVAGLAVAGGTIAREGRARDDD